MASSPDLINAPTYPGSWTSLWTSLSSGNTLVFHCDLPEARQLSAMAGGDHCLRYAVLHCLKKFWAADIQDHAPWDWAGNSWKSNVFHVIGELMLEAEARV